MFWTGLVNNLSLFSSSIASAYALCTALNIPAYNPVTVVQLWDKVQDVVTHIGIFSAELFITELFYFTALDTAPHSILRTVSNIVEYSLWIELMYYSYHRYIHETGISLLSYHSKNHTSLVVFPVDAFKLTAADSASLILAMSLPNWFVQVSAFEYNAVIYVYLTGILLTNSPHFSKYTAPHYQKMNCNYCLLLPVFDYAFGTLVLQDKEK